MSVDKYFLRALLGAGLLGATLLQPGAPARAQQPLAPERPAYTAPVTAAPFNLRPYHERARQAFLGGNTYEAASAIQDAASEVDRAAIASNGTAQPFLTQVRDAMNNLAFSVYKGQISGLDPINRAFADGYRAMADFFYERARVAWETHDLPGVQTEARLEGYPAGNPTTNTGFYLRGAAENVQNWAEASGQRLSRAGIDMIDAAQNVSVRLIQGSGGNAEQVSLVMEDFGRMVQDFNRWVQPGPGAGTGKR